MPESPCDARGAPAMGRVGVTPSVVSLLRADEADCIADGADALRLFVADLDAELVLEAHDELDDVE